MNLTHISRRLEITFWMAVVALVKDKKTLRFYLPILTCSLLMLTLFVFIGQPSQDVGSGSFPSASTGSSVAVSTEAANGQHNILIILVDRTDIRLPRMEGVWLSIYLSTMPQLTMLPLYPASLRDASIQDKQLKEKFYLQVNGEPSPDFEQALRSKGLWWDNYVVMDERALADLIDLSGGLELSQGKVNGAQAVEPLPEVWGEITRQAMLSQALLIQDLCHQTTSLMQNIDPGQAFEKLSHHMITSFHVEYFVDRWYFMREHGGGLSCEFPTIPELALTPMP